MGFEACDLDELLNLPQDLMCANRWDLLESVLTDLNFIEAKCPPD